MIIWYILSPSGKNRTSARFGVKTSQILTKTRFELISRSWWLFGTLWVFGVKSEILQDLGSKSAKCFSKSLNLTEKTPYEVILRSSWLFGTFWVWRKNRNVARLGVKKSKILKIAQINWKNSFWAFYLTRKPSHFRFLT